MAAPRRRTPTRSAALSGAPLPKGARIPRPALIISLARTIFIGALVLFFASPPILSWAHARERQGNGLLTLLAPIERPSAHAADAGSENAPRDDSDPIAPLLAAAAIGILTPRVVADLEMIGILGATLMLGEALLVCWGMAKQRRALPRIPITYLLVRATQPSTSGAVGRMGTSSTPSGDQFFRAVQQAIPPGTRSERFAGRAPWIAFTLSGIPDKPIDLGMSVADPDAQRRVETAAALRAMLQGQIGGAQIDSVADPLQAALTPGARLAWREYGLILPSHYPLRFLDD